MESYLYKENNANVIPRSYRVCINGDKTVPVPTESQDFWETPFSETNSSMTIKRSIRLYLQWLTSGLQ